MEKVIPFVLIYFILINLLSVVICILDKRRAIKHGQRVSEKNLFLLSVLGGSFLMYITMLIIRHKTQKAKFMIGLPLIIVVHSILIVLFIYKNNIDILNLF